jgi:magnesium-transporting ATPase (P-type)
LKELVVGDLIELHSGDRIPADIRVIETVNFQVNNSNIFATAADSTPTVSSVKPTSRNALTSRNLIFATTFAVEGIVRN